LKIGGDFVVNNYPASSLNSVQLTGHFLVDICLQAIWEELQETVHAVDAMVTQTPEEAGM